MLHLRLSVYPCRYYGILYYPEPKILPIVFLSMLRNEEALIEEDSSDHIISRSKSHQKLV